MRSGGVRGLYYRYGVHNPAVAKVRYQASRHLIYATSCLRDHHVTAFSSYIVKFAHSIFNSLRRTFLVALEPTIKPFIRDIVTF